MSLLVLVLRLTGARFPRRRNGLSALLLVARGDDRVQGRWALWYRESQDPQLPDEELIVPLVHAKESRWLAELVAEQPASAEPARTYEVWRPRRRSKVRRARKEGQTAVLELPWDSGRNYRSSVLPAVVATRRAPSSDERELLLALYREVCASWRTLTDVRFKLLALVPLVSGIVLATVLKDGFFGSSEWARIAVAGLGLAATFGLFTYETRNSDLYDDLISRGRRIEEELGVGTGHFRGRRGSAGWFGHDRAIKVIYGASFVAWIVGLVFALLAASGAVEPSPEDSSRARPGTPRAGSAVPRQPVADDATR